MLPSRTRWHWFRANDGTMATNSKDILDRIYQLDPRAELSPRERTQLFTTLSSPKCLIQSYLEMFSCNSSVNLGTEAIDSKSTLKRIFELGPEAQLSSRDRQELYQAMSPSCLIPAFFETFTLDSGEEYDHFWMDSLNEAFLPLKSNSILLEEVAKVIIKHLEGELMVNPLWTNFGTELLPVIPILLECPVCDKPDETSGRKIIDRIARTMIKMKGEGEENFDKLVCWWRRHANLLDRVVRVCLQAFKIQNKKEAYVKIDGPFLDILKIIYEINKSLGFKLAVDHFYLGQVEDEEFMRKLGDRLLQLHDHKLKTSKHSLQLRLLDFPFLLDVPIKWKFLSLDFSYLQETKKHSRLMETLFHVFRPIQERTDEKQLRLLFEIDDDREKTVESAISNISCRTQESLSLPLEVHFKSDVSLGVNAGGPMKEFFSRLFEELFNRNNHSVFKKLEDSPTCTTYWFNKEFREMEKLKWVGKLFALMFYNKVIITLPFPLLFYKKLLEKSKSNFEDLKLLDPSMAESMETLLGMSDDELSDFRFTVDGPEDEPEIELKPGGKDVVVTTANVREYLELYARHYTAASHFDVFSEGFRNLLSGFALHKRFAPQELMSLFQGGEYDWEAFQQSFRYQNGYTPEHPVIMMFWSVFHDDLNEKQKRDLLRFLTGADHVPIGGFREIGPRIWPLGGYHECKGKPPKDICPEVNTCTGFVVLHLPMYSQREHLKERLLKLLEMKDHGFHKPVA